MNYSLKALLNPRCWIQNYQYSEYWDRLLVHLMTKHKFVLESTCTASLGGHVMWIENHPYASFVPFPAPGVRPSRVTILKAYDKLHSDVPIWMFYPKRQEVTT